MSGGIGKRLRPLTCHLPKPMVPVLNRPVMEHAIDLLKRHGIRDIGVTLHYLPSMISEYFGNGERFGVDIRYYTEDRPLGTGGSVKNAEEMLDGSFVVISGDGFTDMDLSRAFDYHREKGSKATLLLKREPIPLEYGLVITDEEGRIRKFLEKPSWGEVFSDTINTGIYILEPEVLGYYKRGDNFDFSKDLFPRLLRDDIPMYGYVAEGYWCDIGDLNTYIQVQEDIFKGQGNYQPMSTASEGIWIGKNSLIEEGCRLIAPLFIGDNCTIRNGAVIGEYSVIGDNCLIGGGTSIKRSIIWNNSTISRNCEIRRSIICNNSNLDERVRVFEGAVVGPYSRILQDSTIKPGVKIWPYKIVEEGSVLRKDLVWEEKQTRRLFGSRNISGKFNVDLGPEIALGIGSSFSTVMAKKGSFVVSSDGQGTSKTIKGSLISAMMSTGAQVIDIKEATLPICRFGVRHYGADGGIHIYGDPRVEGQVNIELLDGNGANLDKDRQRKVENSLAIKDFKRCKSNELKEPIDINNFSLLYLNEGIGGMKNLDRIRERAAKIVISSPSRSMANLAESLFRRINCNVELLDYRGNMEIEEFQNIIFEGAADLGFIYGCDGERLIVADSKDVINDDKYFLLTLLIGFRSGNLKKAIVPYNLPRIAEEIASKYGGDIIYSKTNIWSLLGEMKKNKADFQYVLNFDNVLASGMILDYIVGEGISLRELVDEIPRYHYLKKEIPCSWDNRGSIIRKLGEAGEEKVEMEEGIRIVDDRGWALIIPDEKDPHLNIYVESLEEEYAEELFAFYHDKIKKMTMP
ncbi:MAG: sugar phosphate nucleotidyltransferase [Tissierellaceae bacterium]